MVTRSIWALLGANLLVGLGAFVVYNGGMNTASIESLMPFRYFVYAVAAMLISRAVLIDIATAFHQRLPPFRPSRARALVASSAIFVILFGQMMLAIMEFDQLVALERLLLLAMIALLAFHLAVLIIGGHGMTRPPLIVPVALEPRSEMRWFPYGVRRSGVVIDGDAVEVDRNKYAAGNRALPRHTRSLLEQLPPNRLV